MPLELLTDLPREIRDMIYTYCLGSSSSHVILLPKSKGLRKPFRIQEFTPWAKKEYDLNPDEQITLSLVRTCRQIHVETRGMFWKLNNIWLSNVQAWIDMDEIHKRQDELERFWVAALLENNGTWNVGRAYFGRKWLHEMAFGPREHPNDYRGL